MQIEIANTFKPYREQKLILNEAVNGKSKFITVATGRQIGKSLMNENLAVYFALNFSRSRTGFITPVYAQGKKIFDSLEAKLTASPQARKLKLARFNRSDLKIEFINGSVIKFYSAERPDSIRGETFDFGIVDEAGFIKSETWDKVIRPTFLVHGKKVIITSTPRGKNSWFYTIFSKKDSRHASFHFPTHVNPHISREELADYELNMPSHVYRQEILAEFLDDGSTVFRNVKDCIGQAALKPHYCGVDIGRQNDYTVVTLMNQIGHVVHVERIRQQSWDKIIAQAAQLTRGCIGYVEVNGVGDPIHEALRKTNPKLEPFVTTSDSKTNIIESLMLRFDNKSIIIPEVDWFVNELEIFGMEYLPASRRIRYAAPPGHHDDGVMSLALCNAAYTHRRSSGIYAIL